MAERKHKRESDGLVETDVEESGFILEPAQVEIGSGYALSVSYDEHDKPIVAVKTYGEVDISKLRREIEKAFPHAQIRQIGQRPSIILAKKNKKKRKLEKK
jgi:hypothetical protein